jgi:hypothetical protein
MALMFIMKMSGGQEEPDSYTFSILTKKENKMKNIKTLGLIITLIIIFLSCEELKDPAGLRGVAVIPAISDINPGIFDSKDLAHSYVEFLVSVPPDTHADKITLLGSYKNNFERITISEMTSLPATVRISSADVAQKLGIALKDIKNGDVFTFELLTLANGTATRSTAVLTVAVACAFDRNLAIGSYHSISPASDWNSEGDITITADPANPYKVYVAGLEEMEGLVEDQGPLVMYIDPATYEVVVPEKIISSDAWGYGSISYTGEGVYNSCNGSYSMYFDISLSAYGNQGTFKFDFTRKP